MNNQNYSNHRRLHPLYHFVFTLLTLGLFIAATINVFQAIQADSGVFTAMLLWIVPVLFGITVALLRSYPLKAQDRAIRAEENLRHYVLTQKLLDARLGVKQIVALRFAQDAEFPALSRKAAEENMRPDEIKKAIKHWKADEYRI